jgi:hypothetical protein
MITYCIALDVSTGAFSLNLHNIFKSFLILPDAPPRQPPRHRAPRTELEREDISNQNGHPCTLVCGSLSTAVRVGPAVIASAKSDQLGQQRTAPTPPRATAAGSAAAARATCMHSHMATSHVSLPQRATGGSLESLWPTMCSLCRPLVWQLVDWRSQP